jgi:hypothetical protein
MVQGCTTPQGVGYMCKIDRRMDAELYTNILQDDLLATVEFYELDRDEFIFQPQPHLSEGQEMVPGQ